MWFILWIACLHEAFASPGFFTWHGMFVHQLICIYHGPWCHLKCLYEMAFKYLGLLWCKWKGQVVSWEGNVLEALMRNYSCRKFLWFHSDHKFWDIGQLDYILVIPILCFRISQAEWELIYPFRGFLRAID